MNINSAGGIKSLGGAKIEVISADAGDTTEKAKNAAQRLLADEPELVGGTGAWLSSFTLAVTEVTERASLPWLTLSYSDAITNRGFKFVFQTSPTAAGRPRIRCTPMLLSTSTVLLWQKVKYARLNHGSRWLHWMPSASPPHGQHRLGNCCLDSFPPQRTYRSHRTGNCQTPRDAPATGRIHA